ncbi:MAG: VOC family protein [Roseovarius sp.]|nr:VOC family protein [Roseovarius sp.]
MLRASGAEGNPAHRQRRRPLFADLHGARGAGGLPCRADLELGRRRGLPSDSRHFGHLAYSVENIYEMCRHLMENGVTINRPPRDGHMAFVRSPDNISIELLQEGEALAPQEPWASMENTGHW